MLPARMGRLGVKQNFLPQSHIGELPLGTPTLKAALLGQAGEVAVTHVPSLCAGCPSCSLPLLAMLDRLVW